MKLNNLDLNKIRVFCQIVDSGTYRQASEVLNVTPSALSQTVTGLEYALGFQLFHRVGRRLVPTALGLQLHKEFRAHEQGLLRALQHLSGAPDEATGLLRIGAYLEFAKSHLAPVVARFASAHPAAQIKMTFDTPSRLQEMLEADQLDLCFSIFPSQGATRLESRPLCREELVLIAPKRRSTLVSREALLSESPSYDDVMRAPMVEYYFNHQPIRRWLYLHFRRKPREVPVRILASTAEMVLSLVAEGAGIGVVPRYLLDGSERSRAVHVIRPTSAKLTDHIWLLEKPSSGRTGAHRAFQRELQTSFAGSK